MRIYATLAWVSPMLAIALGATAQAHEAEKGKTPDAPVASSATTTNAASMIVVRDRETGRLRAPTAEEAEKLIASGRGGRAPVEPYAVRAKPGTRAMALGDHGMSHQIARKNAQGGVDEVCVTGDENVSKAFSAAKGKAHE